jgi:hypothetical protein
MTSIRVPFTITARPADAADGDVPVVGLTVFDKQFVSPTLIGTSVVQMVSALGAEGPLAYVALERVEGSIEGSAGAFVLRHTGAIVDGAPTLQIEVVAGSGTGGLAGITGHGTIEHHDGGADLVLDYELPA